MNARELHDKLARGGVNPDLAEFCAGHATILRALDLLARVEESEDELVRELREREEEAQQFGSSTIFQRSAAALVALKAERDSLKAHAEAMANRIEWYAEEGWVNGDIPEAKSYRRDFPKDAP